MNYEEAASKVQELSESKRYFEMARFCKEQTENFPEHHYFRIQLGIAYHYLGRHKDAIISFQNAIKHFGGLDEIPPPLRRTIASYGYSELLT